jgi:hypothetical protein
MTFKETQIVAAPIDKKHLIHKANLALNSLGSDRVLKYEGSSDGFVARSDAEIRMMAAEYLKKAGDLDGARMQYNSAAEMFLRKIEEEARKGINRPDLVEETIKCLRNSGYKKDVLEGMVARLSLLFRKSLD